MNAACLNTLRAGSVYFALVFAAGFVLGIIRELWAAPRFGIVTAELMEAPIMLVVIVLAAQWAVFRFRVEPSLGHRLGMGAIALSLLLIAEAAFVLGLRQLTLPEYIASRDPVSGTVYLVMLAMYALIPLGCRRDV